MANIYSRTRIKICGLTRAQDVVAAVNLGVDAIGMVFYPKSKRYLSIADARNLRKLIPAFVSHTALFVNPDQVFVNQVIDELKPDLLQFHGDETADFCAEFSRPYIKAFRVGAPEQDNADNLVNFCMQYDAAAAWLFDSYTSAYGGSGQSFDVKLLKEVGNLTKRPAIILSGGLDAGNIRERISIVKPYAVDFSSSVESAPGIKDQAKMANLIQAVQESNYIVK